MVKQKKLCSNVNAFRSVQVRQTRQRALGIPHVGPIEPQRAEDGRRLGVAPAVRQAPGRPLLLQHPLPQPQHGRVVRGAGGQAALRVELLGVGRHGAALSKARLKRVSSRPATLGVSLSWGLLVWDSSPLWHTAWPAASLRQQ